MLLNRANFNADPAPGEIAVIDPIPDILRPVLKYTIFLFFPQEIQKELRINCLQQFAFA
jgi:hypothetical protein